MVEGGGGQVGIGEVDDGVEVAVEGVGEGAEGGGLAGADVAGDERREALLEGGVDLFMIETISRVDEMVVAIEAVKSVSDLPIVAQVTFTTEGSTYFGSSPAETVQKILPMDVNVIGANCSVGPQKMLEVMDVLCDWLIAFSLAQAEMLHARTLILERLLTLLEELGDSDAAKELAQAEEKRRSKNAR